MSMNEICALCGNRFGKHYEGSDACPDGSGMNFKPKPIFVPLLDNGNGQVMANFMICHVAAFAGREIHMARASDSHADRGMNRIACDFLESNCDIWFNIDADILFQKKDIDRILSHDLPLVYGIYPKKQDDTPPCIACLSDEGATPNANGLLEVRRAGRGFMCVHRALLEAMKEENGGPCLLYDNHGRKEWDFFKSGLIEGEYSTNDGKREWISEDWMFCDNARRLGYKVYADSKIVLGHEGSKVYHFSAEQTQKI